MREGNGVQVPNGEQVLGRGGSLEKKRMKARTASVASAAIRLSVHCVKLDRAVKI
jgi:hypothetical protein